MAQDSSLEPSHQGEGFLRQPEYRVQAHGEEVEQYGGTAEGEIRCEIVSLGRGNAKEHGGIKHNGQAAF